MFARIWRYIEGPVLLLVPLCMGIMLYLGIAQSALLMLAHAGAFRRASGSVRTPALLAYGAASGLLYGVIINAYDVIGFVQLLTVAGAIAHVSAAVPFDLTHSAATCVFLAALYVPWTRRIDRVVRKYGLRAGE